MSLQVGYTWLDGTYRFVWFLICPFLHGFDSLPYVSVIASRLESPRGTPLRTIAMLH